MIRCKLAIKLIEFVFCGDNSGCVPRRKSKIGFLNLIRICVSLLTRSIQDHSNHAASKQPKNPSPVQTGFFLVPLTHHDLRELGLICLEKKYKSVRDLRIQSCIKVKVNLHVDCNNIKEGFLF